MLRFGVRVLVVRQQRRQLETRRQIMRSWAQAGCAKAEASDQVRRRQARADAQATGRTEAD